VSFRNGAVKHTTASLDEQVSRLMKVVTSTKSFTLASHKMMMMLTMIMSPKIIMMIVMKLNAGVKIMLKEIVMKKRKP